MVAAVRECAQGLDPETAEQRAIAAERVVAHRGGARTPCEWSLRRDLLGRIARGETSIEDAIPALDALLDAGARE